MVLRISGALDLIIVSVSRLCLGVLRACLLLLDVCVLVCLAG